MHTVVVELIIPGLEAHQQKGSGSMGLQAGNKYGFDTIFCRIERKFSWLIGRIEI